MKQFYELLAKRGYPVPTDEGSSFVILSATSTTEGYLLVSQRKWGDGSIREDAWLIVEDQYGPNKGELRVGWMHKILEHYVEEQEEKVQ